MSRSAISRASSSGRKTPGGSAISRASCSTASRLLSNDSRPASCHGSRPRRVRAEITLNGIPSISSPTAANRNLSRSGRNGRKDRRNVIAEALECGQEGPVLGSWSSTPSVPPTQCRGAPGGECEEEALTVLHNRAQPTNGLGAITQTTSRLPPSASLWVTLSFARNRGFKPTSRLAFPRTEGNGPSPA